MFVIGPWQEYALAQRLQAARAAERNVLQVLHGTDDYDDDDNNSKDDHRSASIALPFRRRPRYVARAHAQPRDAPSSSSSNSPQLPPPPAPPQQPFAQPWAKTRQRVHRQKRQKSHAGHAQVPRRLLTVERMRRAYTDRGEDATLEGSSAPDSIEVEKHTAENDSASKPESLNFAESSKQEKEGKEDEEVDQLMLWVQGLESEEESERSDPETHIDLRSIKPQKVNK